jgi:fucose 4-O-acetylase-like acetyltransferase
MTRALSQKMRFLTFISIALLGYVHGYNLNNTYLAPYSSVDEPLTFTTFIEYFFANGFLRFRIPILFLISGYLYAQYDNRPYGERTKKRFKTLIIPYLIWSAIGLVVTFILQQFPFTAYAVQATQLDQMSDNRPYTEIGWKGILIRWLLVPISFQLWFIFTLFFYNAMYPLFKWLLQKVPWLWLGFTFFLCFTFFNIRYLEGQGLFYFSLGIWLQKNQINISREPKWFSLGLAWIFFLGLCTMKTFIAFEFEPQAQPTYITLGILHNLTVYSGILAIWFSVDRISNWWMQQKLLSESAAYSFFIYGMHIPLLAYVMKMVLLSFDSFAYIRLLAYFLVPFLIILFCIGLAYLVKKIAPGFYRLATGGRGF